VDKRKALHLSAQLIFVGAAFGIFLAFVELAANLAGVSLIGYGYPPGRLLELSATLLTYVIAVLAWEVLSELKAR
jgi:hypothetical protein